VFLPLNVKTFLFASVYLGIYRSKQESEEKTFFRRLQSFNKSHPTLENAEKYALLLRCLLTVWMRILFSYRTLIIGIYIMCDFYASLLNWCDRICLEIIHVSIIVTHHFHLIQSHPRYTPIHNFVHSRRMFLSGSHPHSDSVYFRINFRRLNRYLYLNSNPTTHG